MSVFLQFLFWGGWLNMHFFFNFIEAFQQPKSPTAFIQGQSPADFEQPKSPTALKQTKLPAARVDSEYDASTEITEYAALKVQCFLDSYYNAF